MNQFFYIRKSKNDPKTGTIYKAVYDDRTPISRDSLKIKIPIKYWDDKKQQVRASMEIDHEKYNFIINQYKSDFLAANKKAVRTNRDCFIEFAMDYLEKNYPGKEKEMFDNLSQTQPIGRMGKPQEVADLVLYLCSDEASFITGSAYDVDGGTMTLR